ncbi:MAG TPA: DUF2118 domain-containing protein [Chromatiaceae bacterium]|nr:DUF2118 domain-containing protein [Chromatiaceae bacterium]
MNTRSRREPMSRARGVPPPPSIYAHSSALRGDEHCNPIIVVNDTFSVPRQGARALRTRSPCTIYCWVPPYAFLDTLVDAVEAVSKCPFVVYPVRSTEEALLVPKGVKLSLLEVCGASVRLLKTEGDAVRKREPLAYVLTRKREVRVVRASGEGVVVYISELSYSHPERYVIALAGAGDVRRLRRASG